MNAMTASGGAGSTKVTDEQILVGLPPAGL